jgi:hypothetical protein
VGPTGATGAQGPMGPTGPMGPPGPAGSGGAVYFAQQRPSTADIASSYFVDVPGVSFDFTAAEGQVARVLLTAQVIVWRPGGGPVTCGLFLGDDAPFVLDQVTLTAPANGNPSAPFYFSVMRGRSLFSSAHKVQLQVARSGDTADGGCRVQGAALEIALR